MSQTISAARKSSSALPQVLSHNPKRNGLKQRIDNSQKMNYVLNSKRTRHSWARMKLPHLPPPIQTRVLYMPPLRRHMLLPPHWLLQFRLLPRQWSPQVRPPPSLAFHRLRAFSQEYLPSHLQFQACLPGRSLRSYFIHYNIYITAALHHPVSQCLQVFLLQV